MPHLFQPYMVICGLRTLRPHSPTTDCGRVWVLSLPLLPRDISARMSSYISLWAFCVSACWGMPLWKSSTGTTNQLTLNGAGLYFGHSLIDKSCMCAMVNLLLEWLRSVPCGQSPNVTTLSDKNIEIYHITWSGSAITPCRKSHIALVQYWFFIPGFLVITLLQTGCKWLHLWWRYHKQRRVFAGYIGRRHC